MIGPALSTIRHYGKDQERNWTINLPTALLKELRAKGENFEHLDKIRIWIERVEGNKALPKVNAFRKKNIPDLNTVRILARGFGIN